MNVILITLDACRFDHMSFAGYGRDTCPNLTKASSEMINFLNNYAVIPQSDPAFISILTGMYPHTHGIRDLGQKKTLEVKMLQQMLKEKGYKTAALSVEQEADDAVKPGFDEFNELAWRISHKIKRTLHKTINWKKKYGAAEVVTDQAINWIKKNKENKFFLYLHYMEMHWPFTPPAPYDNMFDPEYKGNHHFNDLNEGKILRGDNIFKNNLSEDEQKHSIAHYDGAMVYIDKQLDRFINYLKNEGLWENSIVIVIGDHGEHLGEHNIFYHHVSSVYQPAIRVPFLMKIPSKEGKKIEALTQSIDILPTIQNLLDLEKTKVDGVDLISLIEEGKSEKQLVFAESGISLFEQNPRKHIEGVDGKMRMVTDGTWKLIYTPHPEENKFELYKISEDPLEKNDIADTNQEKVEELKKHLFAWIEKKEIKVDEPFTEKEEAKVKDRLRRLGYID